MTTVTWHPPRSAPRLHAPGMAIAAALSVLLWAFIALTAAVAF